MRRLRAPLPALLAVLFLLGSVAQGYAYRYARPIADPELIAFLQAGGSLDDICGGVTHRGIPCEQGLAGPALLPDPVAAPRPAGHLLSRAPRLAARTVPAALVRDPGHGVRGPPMA